jgi:aspartate kinase
MNATSGNAPLPGAKPLVMKFGGSSVADAERLRSVAELVRARAMDGGGVLVVLSALGGATDGLFATGRAASKGDEAGAFAALEALMKRHEKVADELFDGKSPDFVSQALEQARVELLPLLRGAALLKELPPRSADLLYGRGEILSSTLLAAYMGVAWADARGFLKTDSRFGEARPSPEAIRAAAQERLAPLLAAGSIVVTQGYIGCDPSGLPTTLGRGGSDYSASLLGAALGAREIQIWTDVEGVLSCDPRVVPEAHPIEVLGYDEAAELAAFGAKVLHPATILPAVELGIPVTVRNSMVPEGRFTTISRNSGSGRPVTALASRGPVSVLTVRDPRMLGGAGFLARIFEVFGRLGVSVDLVSTSEVSVSVTLDPGAPTAQLEAELSQFASVRVDTGKAIVALVGEELKRTKGVAGMAFGAMRDINVEMISLGSNEINLSFVVDGERASEALRRLHAAFFAPPAAEAAP